MIPKAEVPSSSHLSPRLALLEPRAEEQLPTKDLKACSALSGFARVAETKVLGIKGMAARPD